MTDITKTFRALIKAKQVSSDFHLNLNRRAKKPEQISTRFLSQAKLILNDIFKLKHSLIESRTNYLSPSYLLSTCNRIMNDEQRLHFEQQIETQIKQCRDELEKLKTSIGTISFSGQRRSHYELVTAYLERDLVQCTKIYSEQKCLRYKRESERKKIGRLDHDEQQMLFSIQQHQQVSPSREAIQTSPETTSSSPVTSTTTFQLDEEMRRESNEETKIDSPEPTGQELRQLQHENKQLYQDVAERSEEIRGISTQVVEIAQLQNQLFENIFNQKDIIQQVDASAVASNDDLAAAIIHIRDAIRNTAQMRRWVIFFLLVMIFSLLFLDWYNV